MNTVKPNKIKIIDPQKRNVVFDTNVFISALLWESIPHQLLMLAENGILKIFASIEMIEELEDVLKRPKFQQRIRTLQTSVAELMLGIVNIRALALFEKDKFDWCLFLGHLVLEKTLKVYWVKVNQTIPPKTHNLIFIADKSNLQLTEEQQKFLATVTDFNLEARYPDEKLEFYKLCTKSFTSKNLNEIKEMYLWLLNQIQKS